MVNNLPQASTENNHHDYAKPTNAYDLDAKLGQ